MQKLTREHWSSTLSARAIEHTASSCIDENYGCYELDASFLACHRTTQVEYAWKTRESHMPLLAPLNNERTSATSKLICYHFAVSQTCYYTATKISFFSSFYLSFCFWLTKSISNTFKIYFIVLTFLVAFQYYNKWAKMYRFSIFFSWTFQHMHSM